MAKKSKKKEKVPKTSLIIVIILSIMFLLLIALSFNNSNTFIEYNFKDSITVSSLYEQTIIGETKVENNAILPKKLTIKNFVICNFENNTLERTYTSFYNNPDLNSYIPLFNGYSPAYQTIELSSGESRNFSIYVNLGRLYPLRENTKNITWNNQTIPFYIFDIEEDVRTTFNLCENKNIEDAIKRIDVRFEIPKQELENER